MAEAPLMPKATAIWLIENTTLTFQQISDFCQIHPLEIKSIADGETATSILPMDPMANGQIEASEIKKGEADESYKLKIKRQTVTLPRKTRKGPRYTPLSRRQDRPNAIFWLVRNHPEMKDAQISRLVGTTKNTIEAVRNRTHWNYTNLKPSDPVTMGLCTQIDLDAEVAKAAKNMPKEEQPVTEEGLKPLAETILNKEAAEAKDAGLANDALHDALTAEARGLKRKSSDDEAPDSDSIFGKIKN